MSNAVNWFRMPVANDNFKPLDNEHVSTYLSIVDLVACPNRRPQSWITHFSS